MDPVLVASQLAEMTQDVDSSQVPLLAQSWPAGQGDVGPHGLVQAKLTGLHVSGGMQSSSRSQPGTQCSLRMLQYSPRAHWLSVEQSTAAVPHLSSTQDWPKSQSYLDVQGAPPSASSSEGVRQIRRRGSHVAPFEHPASGVQVLRRQDPAKHTNVWSSEQSESDVQTMTPEAPSPVVAARSVQDGRRNASAQPAMVRDVQPAMDFTCLSSDLRT
jgi:hypothetical protein